MSNYNKHNWTDGELITAEKLNNIENEVEELSNSGGNNGSGVLCLTKTVSDDADYLSETWETIFNHMTNGGVCYLMTSAGLTNAYQYELLNFFTGTPTAGQIGFTGVGTPKYGASSPTDYPSYYEN